MEPVIMSVKNLRKVYITHQRGSGMKEVIASLFVRKKLEVEALKGISFDIRRGEMVGFLGPNGAGKSTTLKILSGVLFPSSGDVRIMDYVPWKDRKRYVRQIGAVFGQKSQLLWDIPPLDAFQLNRAIYGVDKKEFEYRLDEMAELLDVKRVMKIPTRVLSLGERMKCEFIMAMLHYPQIVFLDEPTIGLDVVAKERIREFVAQMNRQGVTFLLTTHDLDDVERMARRVVVVNHGELVFDDSIRTLKQSLGNKKIVMLTTERPIPADLGKGTITLQNLSSLDRELELDTAQMDLPAFLRQIDDLCGLKDLSVQELPIEEVIKSLYRA